MRDQGKLSKVRGPGSSLPRIRMGKGVSLTGKLVGGPALDNTPAQRTTPRNRVTRHDVAERRDMVAGAIPLHSSGCSFSDKYDVKGACGEVGLSRGGEEGGL